MSQEIVQFPNGQVYIRSGNNIDDWMYIELQGELQSTAAAMGVRKQQAYDSAKHLLGVPLGELEYEPKGKATLRIGNHLLTGKYKELAKPFIITKSEPDIEDTSLSSSPQPQSMTASSSSSSSSSSSTSTFVTSEPTNKRLRVLGIVRGKYVFDSRPAPIVSGNIPKV